MNNQEIIMALDELEASEFKKKALAQGVKVFFAKKLSGKIVVQYAFFLDESNWITKRMTHRLSMIHTKIFDCDYDDIKF